MSEHGPDPDQARSFGRVAEAYDRARPSYPRAAAQWLTGPAPARVVELGAGTGKLTGLLSSLGHQVLATDASEEMLRVLAARIPRVHVARGVAERLPVASRSVDVVVAAEAFHWFDPERTLAETARVLRPGGRLALVWNQRDERIPWVKRLGTILGESTDDIDPTRAIDDTGHFEQVQTATFRFWQPMTLQSLRDLVNSRSSAEVISDPERERVLRKVDELYAEYGRGADGMLVPYLTRTFRTTVLPALLLGPEAAPVGPGDVDTEALLIDFR